MQATGLKGYHLSIQQARLWSLQGASSAYKGQCMVWLEGRLDMHRFLGSLQYLLDQHSILRTTFFCMPDMEIPLQVVTDEVEAVCPLIDLGNLSSMGQKAQLDACFGALLSEPSDLEYASLLSISLLRLTGDQSALLISLPSLCADDRTLLALVTNIMQTYCGDAQDRSQPAEPLQYADVSAWQQKLLTSDEAESQREYWNRLDLSQLSVLPIPLTWQNGEGKMTVQGILEEAFSPCCIQSNVDADLCEKIQKVSQQYGISVSAWLLACWYGLLWRLGGGSLENIGVVCDGRTHEELAGAPGLYARVVPVRLSLSAALPFEQASVLVNTALQEALKKQGYFSWDSLEGNEADTPLGYFPVSFEYSVWPQANTMGGITVSLYRQWACIEPFALKLTCLHSGSSLQLVLYYSPSAVIPEYANSLLTMLNVLLQNAAEYPMVPIGSLQMLSVAEQQHLQSLYRGRNGVVPALGLHGLFEEQARRVPHCPAVISTSECLTYHDVNGQANRLARALRRFGVGPNVLVGLSMQRSVSMVIGLLAILKAGGAYVPLDSESPEARLLDQLRDSHVPLLLTQRALESRLPSWDGQVLYLESLSEAMVQEDATDLHVRNDPDDLAYVIYTSGSTGQSKGVMVSHHSVVNYTRALCEVVDIQRGEGIHFATVSTLAADLGNTAIFCALASGGCVQVLDYETITSFAAFARWTALHPIDVLKIVPSHLSALLAGEHAERMLPRRALILGGEALAPSLLQKLCQLGGTYRVYNHYGPTEATIGVLVNPLGDLEQVRKFIEGMVHAGAVPLGRPIANCEAYLLDERFQVVPTGVIGELYLGGMGLARGYLQRPELTAACFVPHPFGRPGERLYKTGDLVRSPGNGRIEFVGRRDNQVKVRGYRVELGEISAVLKGHPAVWDGVVVLRKDELVEPHIVGYVVARQQPAPTSQQLQDFLRVHLPEYMIPVAFVVLEKLPLTANGKVDQRQLPLPQHHALDEQQRVAGPRGPIEEMLLAIWKDLLAVSAPGVHDNFFQLGGHSLLATQVISRLRAMFRVELSVLHLFEFPTVAELAHKLEQTLRGEQESDQLPLVPVARTQDLPLSFAQERLWFLDQMAPGDIAYNKSAMLWLRGILNVEALQRSLREIVLRHESLRTTFQIEGDSPLQVIHSVEIFRVPLVDLRALEKEEREREAHRLSWQEGQRPFNLAMSPLLRMYLIQLDAVTHLLLLTMHHIIADGWSNGILARELTAFYQGYVSNRPPVLRPLPIQYVDFAVWQRQWLQGQTLERHLLYWRERLANMPAHLDLPADFPRPPVQSFHGMEVDFNLSPSLSLALIDLSRKEAVTLFMLLLAAFQIVLWRYSGQSDIVVGTPIANRTRSELEDLVGFFANTLVLRADLAGNTSFRVLLQRVRAVCLGAYAHQDLPFEKLVEELRPERDLSRNPLFQVMFGQQNAPGEPLQLAELRLSFPQVEHATAKLDLSLFVWEDEGVLWGTVQYSTDLFEEATIRRFVEHWKRLLEGIAANPEQRIAEFPLLSAQEQRQILVEWNDTRREYAADCCIHQLFEERARTVPDRVAVVCEGEVLTYTILNQLANQLAHYLYQLEVRPGVLVGVCMERSLALVISLVGILKAGAAYVPLDPDYPADRLAFMLQDAQVPVLLTGSHQQNWLENRITQQTRIVCLSEIWEELCHEEKTDPDSEMTAENLIYVIYTSGSTGKPKGVMNTHKGLYNRLLWMQEAYQLTVSDSVLQKTPYSFDVSVWEFFWPLMIGARLVLARPDGQKDVVYLASIIAREAISVLHFVPSMLQVFLGEPLVESYEALRLVICSGEALHYTLQESFFARLNAELHNLYGPTEAAIDVTYWQCQAGKTPGRVPIGYPLANTQIYLLDTYYQPVPIGVVGEIYIGGRGLAWGYLNRAELTADRFLPNPFAEEAGARLYKTGDLARYWPDGSIEYLRRSDHQAKLRGFRVEPGEIEATLRQHPMIQECVVQVREVSPGDQQLITYLVPDATVAYSPLQEQQLILQVRQFTQKYLPAYMVPTRWQILDHLPLMPNGKIDWSALPAPSENSDVLVDRSGDVPQTSWEKLLVTIWSEVLGQRAPGVHENFFELGGHSLLATRVVSRLRQLGVEVSVRSLFEAPTVAQLARVLDLVSLSEDEEQPPPLVPISREQPLPLSFAQQRLWFLYQLDPQSTAYLTRTPLRLQGRLFLSILERSFEALLTRHESLRTTFQLYRDQPVQVIHPPAALYLPVVDLQRLKLEEREREMRRLSGQASQLPCNLEHGPLVCIYLFRLAREEHVLLVIMHHIITDGWSLELIAHELTELYRAFIDGENDPLPLLPVQYADFAYWQRKWLQGEQLEFLLSYWKKQLAGLSPLKLPTDSPRGVATSHRGAIEHFHVPADVSERLTRLCQQEGVSLFMVMLAGFQVLLHRSTGQDDIVVGTDIAHRNRTEVEGLIGFFVNQLVLRCQVTDEMTFRQLLGHVRHTTLEAYAHQDLPFEKLVEVLPLERGTQSASLFQVKILVQNDFYAAPVSHETLLLHGITVSPLSIETEAVQNDLILRVSTASDGFDGTFTYSTDLFEAGTIARMARHFTVLLANSSADPDGRLNTLEMIGEEEKERERMHRKERETKDFHAFKTLKPKAISLQQGALIQTSYLKPEEPLPLVVRPLQAELDLVEWAKSNRTFIETELLKHGALLLRGFQVSTAAEFEQFAVTICADLFNENGEHVPAKDVGAGNLYTPVFYAPEKKLLWHNENSFNYDWPMKILFYCALPAMYGGETPIADSRKVFQQIDPSIQEMFMRKGIMYIRNYGEGLGLDWQTVFRTKEKAAVEAYCRQTAVDFEWKDGNRLRTSQVRPAIAMHPRTGDLVWWNQATHWHPACLDQDTRDSLFALFAEEDLPRNCRYGDGSPIEDDVIAAICTVYAKIEVAFPWEQGDILLLDNMLTAHARNPFQGPRKIYVSMGDMITVNDLW